MGHITFGRTRHGEKSGSKWRGINLVPIVFGLCAAKTETKVDESMQAGEIGHLRIWKDVKTNLNSPGEKGPVFNWLSMSLRIPSLFAILWESSTSQMSVSLILFLLRPTGSQD